jgi:hypothetical protein
VIILKGFPKMPPEMVLPGGLLCCFLALSMFVGMSSLMIHFNELSKKDREGSIRRIAEHLGFTPLGRKVEQDSRIYCFQWMKAHPEKFTAPKMLPFKLL